MVRTVSKHWRKEKADRAASHRQVIAGSKGFSSGWGRLRYVVVRRARFWRPWHVQEKDRSHG